MTASRRSLQQQTSNRCSNVAITTNLAPLLRNETNVTTTDTVHDMPCCFLAPFAYLFSELFLDNSWTFGGRRERHAAAAPKSSRTNQTKPRSVIWPASTVSRSGAASSGDGSSHKPWTGRSNFTESIGVERQWSGGRGSASLRSFYNKSR